MAHGSSTLQFRRGGTEAGPAPATIKMGATAAPLVNEAETRNAPRARNVVKLAFYALGHIAKKRRNPSCD